jgi:hypothetical protein
MTFPTEPPRVGERRALGVGRVSIPQIAIYTSTSTLVCPPRPQPDSWDLPPRGQTRPNINPACLLAAKGLRVEALNAPSQGTLLSSLNMRSDLTRRSPNARRLLPPPARWVWGGRTCALRFGPGDQAPPSCHTEPPINSVLVHRPEGTTLGTLGGLQHLWPAPGQPHSVRVGDPEPCALPPTRLLDGLQVPQTAQKPGQTPPKETPSS